MQREIKFRAWNPEKTKIVEFIQYQDKDGSNPNYNWMFNHYDQKSKTWDFAPKYAYHLIQQYTGLKDRFGREIYDGDILFTGMRRGDASGWSAEIVAWNARAAEWGLLDVNTQTEFMQMQKDQQLRIVLGNTYENPELL